MALGARQRRRYTSFATIYRRRTFASEIYSLVAQGVPCGLDLGAKLDRNAPLVGGIRREGVQSSDAIHFEAGTDVLSADVIEIEGGGWFQTSGESEIHEFRGRFLRISVNNCVPLTLGQIEP